MTAREGPPSGEWWSLPLMWSLVLSYPSGKARGAKYGGPSPASFFLCLGRRSRTRRHQSSSSTGPEEGELAALPKWICDPLRTDSARDSVSYLPDDEEEKSDRDRKQDHFHCEKGNAEAAINRVSPQCHEKPSCAGRQNTYCSF